MQRAIPWILVNFAAAFQTMDMIEEIYHDVILSGWVTAFILGVCLLCCRVPRRAEKAAYVRSSRILGVAYLIFGVAIAQFTFFNLRETAPNVAVAWPLSYYYLEGILFGMSFCSLLDRNYISRQQMRRDFGGYLGFLCIAWSGALLASGNLRTVMLVMASVWFFIAASCIAVRFLKIYHNAVSRINDFYADNVEGFVKWLHKSTYGIIFFGLCGSVLSFAPQWGNTIFMLCGIVMFTYIYISLQSYILNYEYVEPVVMDEPGEAPPIPADDNGQLRGAIMEWVAAGGYREPGVTLEKVAETVASNRSYVSAFINSEYQCNFREWINSLRMEYAKKMLENSPEMTIERISSEAGFSSSAYFCRQFSKREGSTPSKWRETAASRSSSPG